ncbi:hypothetical protein ABEB36_011558 [Hypothenemus hampei]|uniref:chitin synthase n=1 Tax=Hypothenemus hampei TaxID=57062 RepID=A0ABD1E8F7_HYPHA
MPREDDDYYDDDFNDDDSLLGSNERQGEEVKPWNRSKIIHRTREAGSTAENKLIENGTLVLKLLTIVLVFVVVLGAAVVSKGSLLFITSQIKKNTTRNYCNQKFNTSRQFAFTVPDVERATWFWLITFAYFIPELGTFIRSIRIMIFKKVQFPRLSEFLGLLLTESLPAIGSSLLIFIILPEIDVVKGAMLTNGMSVIPALVLIVMNFINNENKNIFTLENMLDIIALFAQVSAFVAWPLLPDIGPILWLIPVSLILISFGWWENFLSETSSVKLITRMAKARKSFTHSKYFCYSIISIIKCILFLGTALLALYTVEGDISFLFNNITGIFGTHDMKVQEIEPTLDKNLVDARSIGDPIFITNDIVVQVVIWLICISSTYICYAFGKFASKIMIQGAGFAFPISLVVPVLISCLVIVCGFHAKDECVYTDTIPAYLFFNSPKLSFLKDFVGSQYAWIWLFWLLSQMWITRHIWINGNSKLASTEQIFMRPMYDAFLIDQSLAMNRRTLVNQFIKEEVVGTQDLNNDHDHPEDNITRLYACATMWHENKEEMMDFLMSIFRMDEDQAAHRVVKQYLQLTNLSYYEWETHIFFDDAFWRESEDDNDPILNDYVQTLIETIGVAATEHHKTTVRLRPPVIYPTPYGGRLVWTLPGKTKLIVHLKDKAKIRAKKRWSQVMYMYFLLGHKIMDNDEFDNNDIRIYNRSRNTYILALDGDIDFQPEAVHLLVQYMKKTPHLGAACGRIHPVGGGAMAWYQIFEYAVGHWMQKATEHVIGCVLCSPGCFSLFRASALMDHNVMARYTTRSSEARHYVQYDQGEDRWLCTLLLQRGYRVEYSAASDAYTHCPEGFNEFYNQRRRWMPSTMANILDLLEDSKHIVKVNNDISSLYIFYQIILMIGTVIGPGTIFLMLIGAFVTVFGMSQFEALWWNVGPILIFVLVCILCESNTQLLVAAIISAIYGLIMLTVLIGVAMQIKEDGILAPSSLFFLLMMGEYVIAAMVHPKEFYCLKYGIVYLITVPSMYMLLVIYSVFNMNNVSWGTRDVSIAPKAANVEQVEAPPKKKQSMIVSGLQKLRDFFMSCRSEPTQLLMINNTLSTIVEKITNVDRRVQDIEMMIVDPDSELPKRTGGKKTTFAEGSSIHRQSILRRQSSRQKSIILEKPGSIIGNELDDDMDDGNDSSIGTPSDDLQNNSWFYNGDLIRGHVTYLDNKEETFWKDLISAYLHPIEDDKEKVAKDLKDLRDKMAMSFFALNVIFVLIVFLITIKKDILHLQWPFNPKINFTYYSAANEINEILITQSFLELEPIGFVFLIFFFLLMGIQFCAMIIHRFGTFSQIMANTDIDFGTGKIENMTEDEILENDPLKIFKKLIKLQGVNDDDMVEEADDVNLRNRQSVMKMVQDKDKKVAVISDVDQAFSTRMARIRNNQKSDVVLKRETLAAINRRRSTVLRQSQMTTQQNQPFNPENFRTVSFESPSNSQSYDNHAYDENE